ncbi:MerR family transcriptional regulator [Chelativorans alearense]|uniref:MerR family transcriptional regulator n=1 Tax=Chelativorans alearense TaxID=2681495 RepID=UPI0013D24868|nr:helix-turn-helix domain-containing protein [Chelativorans alearense]
MTARAISIGEAARQSGVKVPTIRFYEQIGLMPAPPRSEGNRRQFDEKDLSRLSFIRHARELGFEMDDIRELLALTEQPQRSCHEADSIAARHLREIEMRIAKLQALSGELRRMVEECGHGKVCECQVIHVLADHGKCRSDTH